jgi:hypothetical protein
LRHSCFNPADDKHADQAKEGRQELEVVFVCHDGVEGVYGEQELKEQKGLLFHDALLDTLPLTSESKYYARIAMIPSWKRGTSRERRPHRTP